MLRPSLNGGCADAACGVRAPTVQTRAKHAASRLTPSVVGCRLSVVGCPVGRKLSGPHGPAGFLYGGGTAPYTFTTVTIVAPADSDGTGRMNVTTPACGASTSPVGRPT